VDGEVADFWQFSRVGLGEDELLTPQQQWPKQEDFFKVRHNSSF
jgi:hypothetical protein